MKEIEKRLINKFHFPFLPKVGEFGRKSKNLNQTWEVKVIFSFNFSHFFPLLPYFLFSFFPLLKINQTGWKFSDNEVSTNNLRCYFNFRSHFPPHHHESRPIPDPKLSFWTRFFETWWWEVSGFRDIELRATWLRVWWERFGWVWKEWCLVGQQRRWWDDVGDAKWEKMRADGFLHHKLWCKS